MRSRTRSLGGNSRRALHATNCVHAAAKRDYYEVLGLSRSADEKEIKKAYRKLGKVALRRQHCCKFEIADGPQPL